MLLTDQANGYPRVYMSCWLYTTAKQADDGLPSLETVLANPNDYPKIVEECGRLLLWPDAPPLNYWRNFLQLGALDEEWLKSQPATHVVVPLHVTREEIDRATEFVQQRLQETTKCC